MLLGETVTGKLCYPGSIFQARDICGLDPKPTRSKGMQASAGTKSTPSLEGQTCADTREQKRLCRPNRKSDLGKQRKSTQNKPKAKILR